MRLGMVRSEAQPGDLVVVIQDALYPFVLRQLDDGYLRIVGEAYINGIMHGEKCPETGEQ